MLLGTPQLETVDTDRDENQPKKPLRHSYYRLPEPLENTQCKAQYPWQLATHPTCNLVHEIDLLTLLPREKGRIVGRGSFRNVWRVDTTSPDKATVPVALKTLRYKLLLEPRFVHKHARDARIVERLSSSKLVTDIYAYCGVSSISEFASGGDLDTAIWWHPRVLKRNPTKRPSSRTMLELATQASMGLAAAHNIDKEGVPSFAHTDIDAGQFVKVGNIYKLNDFNRANLLAWHTTSNNSTCGYQLGFNGGKNRSPEEYKLQMQSEKVDVYALGSVLFHILMGREVFEETSTKLAQRLVKDGLRPKLSEEIANSLDPNIIAIKEAMRMCFIHDPLERPTARQIEAHLLQALLRLQPNALKEWGLPPPPSFRNHAI
jgi:serine/threonine protein kinase